MSRRKTVDRDIAYHGVGVLAYCAWQERRQRLNQREDQLRFWSIVVSATTPTWHNPTLPTIACGEITRL